MKIGGAGQKPEGFVRRWRKHRTIVAGLLLLFTAIFAISTFLSALLFVLLVKAHVVTVAKGMHFVVMMPLVLSVILGTVISALAMRRAMRPVRVLINATEQIAAGNFGVRISLFGPEELQQLGASFNSMAKELGSIETLRSDFVSNVSHEFKTPVASIMGFARLLKRDAQGAGDTPAVLTAEERKEYLDIIIRESERLRQLSGNVLLLSKLETQEPPGEKIEYDLDEQIRRAILLLEREWSRKNLTVVAEIEPVKYTGNEELLMQVWTNLLGNAVKFTPPGGEIRVSVRQEDSWVAAEFSDTGIGMDEAVMARIFDKFYQGDESHGTEGNGLGLSLVKRIVELGGGSVSVTSVERAGTTFIVKLPI